MNTLEAIYQRRSVKGYDPNHKITPEEEQKLLEATIQAPTSFNIQHWRFVILRSPELRQKIRQEFGNDQAQMTDASLLILFTADMKAWQKEPQRYWQNAPQEVADLLVNWIAPFHEGREWLQRDEAQRSIGMAMQTLMLAAKGMGYDSCPMIGFDIDKVAELINLPEDHVMGPMVAIGKNDSHTHLIRGGLNYNMELRWDGVPSLADALQMLKEQARRTPAPQWVRVIGGWNEFQFAERRMPTLAEINAVSQDVPVFILNLYNRALLNGAALRALGIDRNTTPPPDSVIEKDSNGNPTGMLIAKPNATILYAAIAQGPRLGLEDQINSTRHYMREMNRLGITSVIDAGGGGQNYPDDYQIIDRLADLAVLSEDYFSVPEERIKHLESVLTIVDGQPVYANAEFSDLAPPPLPISPDWSPVKYFGGYHNESQISFASPQSKPTSSLTNNTRSKQNWNLSSLSMPGSLSQYWGGLACACCF